VLDGVALPDQVTRLGDGQAEYGHGGRLVRDE
jgi:hypothetical protein